MRIGFIGAGKVGVSLGKYFLNHGIDVAGYCSRTLKSAKDAAEFTKTECFDSIGKIFDSSDVLFLTVTDSQIESVWESLKDYDIHDKIFCHCSGAMTSAVFQKEGTKVSGYSIHPMYAFNDRYTSYKGLDGIYFTVEGDAGNLAKMTGLVQRLGNPFKVIKADDKIRYHAACVFVSNLVIGLYAKGAELLEQSGFEKEDALKALMPLFMNNAANIEKFGPVNALTGPIERADEITVKEHLQVLDGNFDGIYRLLSEKLIEIASQKNEQNDYEGIKKLIGEEKR